MDSSHSPHDQTRMILLRSLVFHAAFYLTTTVLALAGLPVLVMNRQKVQAYAKFWTGSSVWLVEKICGTKIVWRGLENLPRGASGPQGSSHREGYEVF